MQIFQIDENLYQSTKIEVGDAEQVKQFDACIDLEGGIDTDAADFKIYLNWPIKDGPVLPDIDILKSVAYFAYSIAYGKKMSASGGSAAGRKVLVHCNQGINRASLVSGEILFLKGMKGRKIVDYIRKKRPGALTNPYFEKYLESLS